MTTRIGKIRIGSFVAVTLVCSGAKTPAAEAKPYVPPDCGIRALYILLNDEAHRVGLDQIETVIPGPTDPRGHSMAELQAAAASCGVKLRGVMIRPSDLPPRRSFIAYIEKGAEGHYLLVRPVGTTGRMVQLVEPPFAPRIIDYDRLVRGRAWTGRVLVVESTVHALWGIWFPRLFAGSLLVAGVVFLIQRARSLRRVAVVSPANRDEGEVASGIP